MRSMIFVMAGASFLATAALPVQAMPAAQQFAESDAPAVTLIAGGCGFGFHPDFRGFCRPNRFIGPRFAYGYGYRRCFVRPGIFGARRVCRY